jgi:hypothetical protein
LIKRFKEICSKVNYFKIESTNKKNKNYRKLLIINKRKVMIWHIFYVLYKNLRKKFHFKELNLILLKMDKENYQLQQLLDCYLSFIIWVKTKIRNNLSLQVCWRIHIKIGIQFYHRNHFFMINRQHLPIWVHRINLNWGS